MAWRLITGITFFCVLIMKQITQTNAGLNEIHVLYNVPNFYNLEAFLRNVVSA
jgi:hypothetical protein